MIDCSEPFENDRLVLNTYYCTFLLYSIFDDNVRKAIDEINYSTVSVYLIFALFSCSMIHVLKSDSLAL